MFQYKLNKYNDFSSRHSTYYNEVILPYPEYFKTFTYFNFEYHFARSLADHGIKIMKFTCPFLSIIFVIFINENQS